MVAIFLPLSYGILCARKWARVPNCRFIYDPEHFCWEYQNCPRSVLEYKFIYPVFTCAGITLCINIVVAVSLLREAFIQELFFANDLIWQDLLFGLIDTPLWWFVCSSLMWELAHTCDGRTVGTDQVSDGYA
ncbi:hypothetical protein ANCCAN_02134 [Ancylostoma caninum]|uniref:7TM GPCR serpentine receptor class x (Srx) domain-containing protein n=1 Tax=Ancylostoma caninum TaxID=29170 RepID=A0A368H5C7_ANCCA|nr:hypothetical protein ANCCAN_02134 [Ancylostoma caninum]